MKRIVYVIISMISALGVLISCNSEESKNNKEINKDNRNTQIKTEQANVNLINDNMELKIETADEKKVQELMNKIHISSSYSSSGHELMIDDVIKYISVSQLRRVDKSEVYSVNKLSSGGLLFVFYSNRRSPDYSAYYCMLMNPKLKFSDFSNIETNISTIEDVKKIDSLTNYNFYNPDDENEKNYYVKYLNEGIESQCFSVHATKDGVINIGYTKKNGRFIVNEVYKAEDDIINSINTKDLK